MSIDNEQSRALLRAKIRSIPDFPKPGILFRDITPVLADPVAFATAVELHLHHVHDLAGTIDVIVGIESRGFLFGPILANRLGLAFVPARKPGKLPAATLEERYELEYGHNALQLHADAFTHGAKVLLVDDLLATGGTAAATARLITRLGGEVLACVFLIELLALNGRAALGEHRVESLLEF
ncbi:MAG: adenine phosphoribosyltransferase [Enhygromyxa sp.]